MTNLMDSKATWKDGQEVSGKYCGVQYRGKIQDGDQDYCSRRTPDGRNFIFVIALDTPITVFGRERNTIEIWTNESGSTIEVA